MLPMELRLMGLALLGVCIGSLLNLAIYRWCWQPRAIGPWIAPLPEAPPRQWSDRVPVLGWFGLRRESQLHGMFYWLRPMFVELATACLLPALYWWEVVELQLQPRPLLIPVAMGVVHVQFLAHALLMCLMIVASVIDLDEKTIPDEITVPGTLIGLASAAFYPWFLLPVPTALGVDFLTPFSPNPWPAWLEGMPNLGSLVVAMVVWWTWVLGLLPRPWRTRRGWEVAWRLLMVRMFRSQGSLFVLGIGLVGSVGIVATWVWAGVHWQGLFTSLIGMLIGGGIIWAVRNVGSVVLGREAMGFGDVTLMAMIGAFVGWQPCLVVFFVAPFFALAFGVVQLIVHRDAEIPYGPFLCMATALILLSWRTVWESLVHVFALGGLIGVVMLGLLVVLAMLLVLIRFVRETIASLRGG